MRTARFYISMGLCSFCILLGFIGLIRPLWDHALPSPTPAPQIYWLRDAGGKVAVYDSEHPGAAPLAVYDIYVNLLPECDILRLKSGWPVTGERQLQRTLEDLGW